MEAYDGEEALFMAKKERPDLILLDIMLPKLNGYKISRLLKFDEAYKDIPIIMLTARSQQKDIETGGETGADEYIIKPFDMDKLVELVKTYLTE
jgi:DNA-binding response OmpR family regulator